MNKKLKYLIYGLGRSGQSALKLALKMDYICWVVNKGKVSSWQRPWFGDHLYSEDQAIEENIFSQVDVIVISPGIDLRQEYLQKAFRTGVVIMSEIEFAYQHLGELDAPIVGITGTNGKTTTTSMLGELIKLSGKSAFVGGNIGIPFCDYILANTKVDFIILELSSFQLEAVDKFHVNVALILNIFQNHGERYNDIFSYAQAKLNIVNNMDSEDFLIYLDDVCKTIALPKDLNCNKISFCTNSVTNSSLITDLDMKKFKLVGMHNILNLYCCLQVAKILDIKQCFYQEIVDTFYGVEFRLQFVPFTGKYQIYNDAKSTNWSATLSALSAFKGSDKRISVIIGGQFRGHGDSIKEYVEEFKDYHIYLIGETTDLLAKELDGVVSYQKAYTIEKVKQFADKNSDFEILLFSPAFPSFDQFENYVARGTAFTSLFIAGS